MEILVAEDNPVSMHLLTMMLTKWGHDVTAAPDGHEALRLLKQKSMSVAIVDWMMPGLDGIDLCRFIRADKQLSGMYIIMLTTRNEREDLVTGLNAGADDYITKPFDSEELHSRLNVGIRVANLQKALADRIAELEAALERVKQLEGLLPICSYCSRIRDEESDKWQKVEAYLTDHTDAEFSHGICPECYTRVVEPALDEWKRQRSGEVRRES